MLKVNEIFKSIQGESSFVGLPCVFVRLTGCHLRCLWCDTSYAFYEGKDMSVDEVMNAIQLMGVKFVELTGGEPLIQKDAYELIRRLLELNYKILVETSGAVPLDSLDPRVIKIMDIKCPGSGMSERMIWENVGCLKADDEVKFVIADREDFDWAKRMIERYKLIEKTRVLFSPVFRKLEPRNLALWILEENLPVRLQLQIHKYIWSPETRGV